MRARVVNAGAKNASVGRRHAPRRLFFCPLVLRFRSYCYAAASDTIQRNSRMGTATSPEDRQIVCSGCLQVVPESRLHVIPYFNSEVAGYVTYRCERCWLPSLEETRTRLANTEDETEIASAAAFFERHGIILYEFKRGDPLPIVRKMQAVCWIYCGPGLFGCRLVQPTRTPLPRRIDRK